ncbi:hypothetical protein BDV06DRAFT_186837 [Aspergillus oleicola]
MGENIPLVLGKRQITTPTVLETLRSILCRGEYGAKVSCLGILASQPSLPPAIIEALPPLLTNPHFYVKELATKALGNQSSLSPATLERVVSLLTDHDGLVRFHVLEVLERHFIFPSTNKNISFSCGEDGQFYTRVSVARILHHKFSQSAEESHKIPINDAAMLSYLDRAQKHQVHLSSEELLQIIELLWDDDERVREHAAELVGKQSPLPPTIIDALVEITQEQ